MGIVYMLSWNGLGYIGSTILSIDKRIYFHHKDYKNGLRKCNSYNIIKNESYEISIIEEVINETEQECREREQFWIEFFSSFGKLENYNNAYGLDIENKNNITKKWFEKKPNYHKENEYKYTEKRKQQEKINKEKINKRKRELYALKKLSLLNTNGKQD